MLFSPRQVPSRTTQLKEGCMGRVRELHVLLARIYETCKDSPRIRQSDVLVQNYKVETGHICILDNHRISMKRRCGMDDATLSMLRNTCQRHRIDLHPQNVGYVQLQNATILPT
jgi:hypothetical protein